MSRFPQSLPTDAVDILAGQSKARDVSEAIHAAYWTFDADKNRALYLLQQAHADLRDLADAMGYTLEAKPTRRIIAERDQSGSFVGWRARIEGVEADVSPFGVGNTEAEAIAHLEEKLAVEAAQ